MADVQQTEKMAPLITCEVPFSQHVSELFFGVNIFDLNLRIEIDSVKQPVLSNSVGSGYVSHCRTSAFDDHLNHCFVVFKKCRASHRIEKTWSSMNHNQHYSIQDCRDELESWFVFGCACLMWCCATSLLVLDPLVSLIGLGKNETLQ